MKLRLAFLAFIVLSANGLSTTAFAKASTASKKMIQVPVTFMEALAPKDTTSSERF